MQSFGGDWTAKKLNSFEKYLKAYLTIFHRNERARNLKTLYLDGFAGSGRIYVDKKKVGHLFPELADSGPQGFIQGSARVALAASPGFTAYRFIESNPAFARELRDTVNSHRKLDARVLSGDFNQKAVQICATYDWTRWRMLVLLDPYGMSVDWTTLQRLAETGAADVWYLFPLGMGLNRLLTKRGLPPPTFQERLDRTLGTTSWRERFYQEDPQRLLDFEQEELSKAATFKSMEVFVQERLESVFLGVARNPEILKNSSGSPMFMFCFGASNPKGASTAVRIAEDVLQL